MLRNFADNHYTAFSPYNLAFLANLLYRWLNFHCIDPPILICGKSSFPAPCDSSARQVVCGHLNRDLVPGKNTDIIHPQFTRYMGQNYMAVLQLHPEHRVWKRFKDRAFEFYYIFLRHKLTLPARLAGSALFKQTRYNPPQICVVQPLSAGQSA